MLGFGILLILSLIDQASGLVGGVGSTILTEISLTSHLDDFPRGIVDIKHIVYYLMVTAVFLFLTVRAVEGRRWR